MPIDRLLQRTSTFTACGIILCCAQSAAVAQPGTKGSKAKQALPTTVTEFFKLLPSKYSGVSEERKLELLKAGNTTIDQKNGFIEFSDCAESRTQLAVFKSRTKGRLLAVSYIGEAIDNKTDDLVDASSFHMLQYDGSKWSDVTAAALPIKLKKGQWIELPQVGTTLTLHDATNKVSKLTWNGSTFRQ